MTNCVNCSEQIPGVDYEEAACPVCGSSDPDMEKHAICMNALEPMPPRGYPHHDFDES